MNKYKTGNIGGCSVGIQQIQQTRIPKPDVCQARNVEKCDKQPMKRKRRHTTDMEDLLAEDEDRLVSGTPTGLNSHPESCIPNKGLMQAENSSEMLSREFSKMYLKDKHRKSKRHCTRYVIANCL